MGIAGFAPGPMKTIVLVLNLVVAAIGTLQFWRAGRLSWRAIYPFAVLGFPFSLLGGAVHLPTAVFYPAVGVILVGSALIMLRSAFSRASPTPQSVKSPPFLPSLLTGAVDRLRVGNYGDWRRCVSRAGDPRDGLGGQPDKRQLRQRATTS